MRNIYILPTENSSRLSYNKDGVLELHRLQWRKGTQNIYITSDEKPKQGEWSLYQNKIHKCIEDIVGDEFKKIILTTDVDLIKDGVQAIDDEFLEWFVKNPSCESVGVVVENYKEDEWVDDDFGGEIYVFEYERYKIIIQKEEHKQETLEEVAKKQWGNVHRTGVLGFIEGAKWQQEQDKNNYSEVFEWLANKDYLSDEVDIIQKEFEQFKKK
jgi:hypothetical protein